MKASASTSSNAAIRVFWIVDCGLRARAACPTGTASGREAGAGRMAGSTVVVNPILQRLNHESTKRRSARNEKDENREKAPYKLLPQTKV
jgi:hypothetical protein